MNVEPLMARVRQDPSDANAWAVLGDALHDTGQHPGRAAAITAELQGALPAPVPGEVPDPDRALVTWRMGHWRHVLLPKEDYDEPLQQLFAEPSAAFVEHLQLGASRLTAVSPGDVPATLRHLRVGTDAPSTPMPQERFAPFLDQLHSLTATGLLDWPLRAPQLRRLELSSVPSTQTELPVLEHLIVPADAVPRLLEWSPTQSPALRRLRLEGRVDGPALDTFLRSPVGQGLEQLELGPDVANVVWAREHLAEHRHLDLLVLDAQGGQPPTGPRARTRAFLASTHSCPILRLAPPATPLLTVRTFELACEQLGIWASLDNHQEWLSVPPEIVHRIAHRMAALSGFSAQVIRATEFVDFDDHYEDVANAITISAGGYELDAQGFRRAAQTEVARRSVTEESEEDGDDVRRWSYELYTELWAGLSIVDTVHLWTPLAWQPDPFELQGPPTRGPTHLSSGDQHLDVDPTLAGYVAWRARASEGLVQADAPDLTRWSSRLLRRYRIRRPPTEDPDHDYWAEWKRLTRAERAARPDPQHIASFKLHAPGRWLLDPDEAQLLSQSLTTSIEGHRCPASLLDGLRALRTFLDRSATEVEVVVTSLSTT